MRRHPAVAGQFYPSSKDELSGLVSSYVRGGHENGVLSAVAPHAGYIYSGAVAGRTYAAISKLKPRVIAVVGPDHTGAAMGRNLCFPSGEWETPLGGVETVAQENVAADSEAHIYEHSIEVQLPFLQTIYKHNFKVSPVIMGDQSVDGALKLGEGIEADLVVASSDFSHYVPHEVASRDDRYAIKPLESMDYAGFYERIAERKISACGYGPIAAAMRFASINGAKSGKLLDYSTSGDITGDKSAVVGYASIIFK